LAVKAAMPKLLPPLVLHFKSGAVVQKSVLLAAIHKKKSTDTSVDRASRESVVVSGCPACRKSINTMGRLPDHLLNDNPFVPFVS